MKHKIKFTTSYNQFYISSDDAKNLTPESQTDQGYSDRLDVLKNTLVVFTQCYGPVKGELILLNQPSVIKDFSIYDHVVEAGLNIESGIIKILDCPYSSIEFEKKLEPGSYRVRIYSSNLASVDIDDDKGGDDYYKIEMWPSDDMERRVLKRYK